jgi:hypothetical protein
MGRARSRWAESVKFKPKEIGWEVLDWNHLAQERLVKLSCEHGNNPSGFTRCWEFLE